MPYEPPDLRNFTRPGGIALFIDSGQGYKHLGNMDISQMAEENKTDELEIDTQLSGELKTALIIPVKRNLTYKIRLQEVTADNLQAYLGGGNLVMVGAGTDTATDQVVTLVGSLLSSVGRYNISGITARQFLNKVFHYDGSAYTDNSVEADSLAGTPFTVLTDANDMLYLGKATKFQEVYFDFATPGVYGDVVVKYWDGSAWTIVSVTGAADKLDADGKMSWTIPSDWAKNTVNGYNGYFLQISATTPWTTPATINSIRQDAVQNTDYIVDPGQVSGGLQVGRIGRLSGGFLADGEEIKVSYTYATWTSITFPIATGGYTPVAARLDMLTNYGTQMRRYIHKCLIKPDGAMSFDGKKELQIPLTLQVLDDYLNNPTNPYGYAEIIG